MSSSFSSSSRNHNSEVRLQGWTYNVFLSYHDRETGKSFAYDLHLALTQAGLVYLNNHNLTIEDHANSSVLQAIEESRISVIVFSSKFDASTRFSEETGKILECRKTIEQRFVHVFYIVDPSYVRYQKGMFGEAFKDLIARSILTKDVLKDFPS